jgi:hypothetical protein
MSRRTLGGRWLAWNLSLGLGAVAACDGKSPAPDPSPAPAADTPAPSVKPTVSGKGAEATPAPVADKEPPLAAGDAAGAPAAAPETVGPAAWEAAYQGTLGPAPEPQEPQDPWPSCATSLVRQPLEAEWRRRHEAAAAAHTKALAAWNAAGQPLRDALAAGVFVTAPPEGAPFKDASPAAATRLRAAFGTVSATPCHVRDVRALTNGTSNEESAAAKSAGATLTGPSAYQILCGTRPASNSPDTFLVTVPSRFVAAKVEGQAITGWHFAADGHFAEELRGRVATIGLGEELEISGVGRLIRGVSNPGFSGSAWAETLWAVDFARACPHEGAGCTFNDGQPTTVIGPVKSGACANALADRTHDMFDAWKAMAPTSADAALLAGWITSLAPSGEAAKRVEAVRKRLAGDLAGAATLFEEASDAVGLAEVAELQLQNPALVEAGRSTLDAAIKLEPRAAWRLRAGGMALQAGDKAGATAYLRALVDAATQPAEANEVQQAAALLKFAGDNEGAYAAETKAASLKAR